MPLTRELPQKRPGGRVNASTATLGTYARVCHRAIYGIGQCFRARVEKLAKGAYEVTTVVTKNYG